jgi:hypothetical protein
VVVHDLHIFDACSSPTEADAKLIVNSNTVLSSPITFECFETIARRHAQVLEVVSDLQLSQLAPSNSLDVDKSLDPLTVRKRLCVSVSERDDHG